MNKYWDGLRPFRVVEPERPSFEIDAVKNDMQNTIQHWNGIIKSYRLRLEEHTGMTDCKGTDIFVGDIVRGIETWQPYDHTGVVQFNATAGAYYITIPGEPDNEDPFMLHEYDCLHVLGNVRDNPDIPLSMCFLRDDDDEFQDECREALELVIQELTGE